MNASPCRGGEPPPTPEPDKTGVESQTAGAGEGVLVAPYAY